MSVKLFRTAAMALAVALIAASAPRAEDKPGSGKDIVDTAVAAGNFKTLVAAVKAAGLAETLKGEGPFTVFAPTDAAFAKLGEKKVAALLKDKDMLKKILTYHVVKGNVMAADAMKLDGKSAKSVEGSPIKISAKDDTVTLNGTAKVTKADIKCKNGVIHVIDTVILPSKE